MQKILTMLGALFLTPLLGCQATGYDAEQTRATAHNLRVGLEPVLRSAVERTGDADKLAEFEKLVAVADEIALAWDAWLAIGGESEAFALSQQLTLGLDAIDRIALIVTDDPDEQFRIQTVTAVLRIVILNTADNLGDLENAERAAEGIEGAEIVTEPEPPTP